MKILQWFKFFTIIILIIWTITLIYFWNCSTNIDNNNYANVLEKLHNQINGLERQYSNIIDISNLIKNAKGLYSTNYDGNENISNSNVFKNPIGEMLRRRTHTNLKELLFMATAQLKNKNLNHEEFFQNIQDRIYSLIADVELISETNTSQIWRKMELNKLSRIILDRIQIIQNPPNCNEAKKLICNLNKGCGFGCQIHHVLYCLILAYSTQRTLILESNNWRYGFKGWDFVFMPLSVSCQTYDKSRGFANWGDPNMNTFINILVPIVDTLPYRPPFLPQAIPRDIYDKLFYLHGDPFVWFAGQLLSYIMRLNEYMTKILNEVNKGQFSQLHNIGPIVGVHVRRTDKVGTEAQFHSLSEYMYHVEAYFIKEEIKLTLKSQLDELCHGQSVSKKYPVKLKRQIILATDEPKLFDEMKQNYPQYSVIGNQENSRTANVGNRYSQEALQAIIIDTVYLSHTNFLVCTFSSQVCRVAYELMQSHIFSSSSGDQGNQFKSLDDIYYFGGQLSNNMVMTQEFEDRQSNFNLKIGDEVYVMGNHWDGWSKGVKNNDKVGLFPTYKAQFMHRIASMGDYNYSLNP